MFYAIILLAVFALIRMWVPVTAMIIWRCVIWTLLTQAYIYLNIFNTLRPRHNGRHFADDILKCIFLNENARISLKISLKCVPKVRINNIPAMVQIMAWRRPGDKPLSEPMMVSLLTHICVTRPQWDTVCGVVLLKYIKKNIACVSRKISWVFFDIPVHAREVCIYSRFNSSRWVECMWFVYSYPAI